MDKIKKKWPDNTELRDKVNELVEGYDQMKEHMKVIMDIIKAI